MDSKKDLIEYLTTFSCRFQTLIITLTNCGKKITSYTVSKQHQRYYAALWNKDLWRAFYPHHCHNRYNYVTHVGIKSIVLLVVITIFRSRVGCLIVTMRIHWRVTAAFFSERYMLFCPYVVLNTRILWKIPVNLGFAVDAGGKSRDYGNVWHR